MSQSLEGALFFRPLLPGDHHLNGISYLFALLKEQLARFGSLFFGIVNLSALLNKSKI